MAPEIERNSYPAAAPEVDIAVAPAPPPKPAPLPLNFHNPIAVRIALLAAVAGTLLSFLVPFLSWLAGGFFAVFYYCRKTGFHLDVGDGVKIGWITGLITFVFASVQFSVLLLPDAISGRLATTILEEMKSFPAKDPAVVQRLTQLAQSGTGAIMLFLSLLVFLFVVVTCLSMAGGALGAKVAERS